MVKIGIDFDNTIVIYDDLFHKIASEENLIPINFPKSNKNGSGEAYHN